jgi:MFS family permease
MSRKRRRVFSAPEEAKRRQPVFAIASILCPVAGVALGVALAVSEHSEAGLIGAIFVAAGLAAAGGTACSIASFLTNEPNRLLAVFGLLASVGPVVGLIIAVLIKQASNQ